MKLRNIIAGGIIILAAAGCAKERYQSSNDQAKLYLESWLKLNHPDAKKTDLGTYVLDETPGTGAAYNGEDYVMVNYTIRSIDGTISTTTSEKTAQQLGTYLVSNYYGPRVWYAGEDKLSVGVMDMLEGMKIGGKKTTLIPSWLMTNERKKNKEDYFKETVKDATSLIYEVTLESISKDILKTQIEDIEAYNLKNFGKVDSLVTGFYKITTKEPVDTTAYPVDTTVYINYIGRLLNGVVFDTTEKDTAKKYGIYNYSKTYEPVKIIWGEKEDEIKMETNGSTSAPIGGFQKLLWNMRRHEAASAVFTFGYGYSTSGSGSSIPGYAPLRFDIEITEKPAD